MDDGTYLVVPVFNERARADDDYSFGGGVFWIGGDGRFEKGVDQAYGLECFSCGGGSCVCELVCDQGRESEYETEM